MNVYEAQMKLADRLRDLQLTPLARLFYGLALRIGGDQDRHCRQMMAVCYVTEHRLKKSDIWFERALAGANDYERGNILRDQARRYIVGKDYSSAINLLEESLSLLPPEVYPGPWASTMGFLGRAHAQQGSSLAAMECYENADEVLREQADLRPCLFNKLHMTRHYLKSGHYGDAELSSDEAWELARRLKMWMHCVRAARYSTWAWCQRFNAHWP